MRKIAVLLAAGLLLLFVSACQGRLPGAEGEASSLPQSESAASQPEAPAGAGEPLQPSENYAGAYGQIVTIANTVGRLLDATVSPHNQALEEREPAEYLNDPEYLGVATLMPLKSMELAITAFLGDADPEANQQSVASAAGAMGYENVQVASNAPGDYTITADMTVFTDAAPEGTKATVSMRAQYDAGTGALHFSSAAQTDEGTIPLALYEFVPLGEDRYAFQTADERALVEYREGVVSFTYTLLSAEAASYDAQADSIYPSAGQTSADWVAARGTGDFSQTITYDGAQLAVEVKDLQYGAKAATLAKPA